MHFSRAGNGRAPLARWPVEWRRTLLQQRIGRRWDVLWVPVGLLVTLFIAALLIGAPQA